MFERNLSLCFFVMCVRKGQGGKAVEHVHRPVARRFGYDSNIFETAVRLLIFDYFCGESQIRD